MNIKDITIEELELGYVQNEHNFKCIYCDFCTDKNEIFPYEGRFFNAEGRMKIHINEAHQGNLNSLLQLPKRFNNLTDNQKNFIHLLNKNYTDKQIATELDIGESTVRHQKFVLREKEQQAKIFLAIMGCLIETPNDHYLHIHESAKQVDERYLSTKVDEDKVKADFFVSLSPIIIKSIPRKDKYKIIMLRIICDVFEESKVYTEDEVNKKLIEIYPDFATLRRYLIEYGFFERDESCSQYVKKI